MVVVRTRLQQAEQALSVARPSAAWGWIALCLLAQRGVLPREDLCIGGLRTAARIAWVRFHGNRETQCLFVPHADRGSGLRPRVAGLLARCLACVGVLGSAQLLELVFGLGIDRAEVLHLERIRAMPQLDAVLADRDHVEQIVQSPDPLGGQALRNHEMRFAR